MTRTYTCALSGIEEEGDDDAPPVGWTTISLRRRVANPAYQTLQFFKAELLRQNVEQMRAQARAGGVPENDIEKVIEANFPFVAFQIDAQYFAMEEGTPDTMEDEDVVFVAGNNPEVLEALNEMRANLGLEAESSDEEE